MLTCEEANARIKYLQDSKLDAPTADLLARLDDTVNQVVESGAWSDIDFMCGGCAAKDIVVETLLSHNYVVKEAFWGLDGRWHVKFSNRKGL